MQTSFIIVRCYFIEVWLLVQNRLLPLLYLIISSQAYSEDSITSRSVESSSTANSSLTVPKDDTQTTSTPSESDQQANSDTDSTEQGLTFEPTPPPPEEPPSTTEQHDTPTSSSNNEDIVTTPSENKDNAASDDGIDEELIAELLNEDDSSADDEKKDSDTKDSGKTAVKSKTAQTKSTESSVGSATWLPEIEFGYRSEQGNEDERSLNARLALSHISGRLRNSGSIKIYMKNEDGKEDERDQTYQLQSDYKISPRFYIYGNFKGIDSKYSSYFHDYTVSSGLGYQLTNTETLKIETELGPGYRYQEPNTDEIDDDDPIFPDNVAEPIIRASLTANWKPLDNTSFKFDGTMVSGSSNTRFNTEISIINYITEDIALKISQNIEHLSRVPNNLEKTDTILTINILYAPK